jgi:adenylate kinase
MFRDKGLLIEVDGLGTVDEVTERIWNAFADAGIGAVETSA